MTELLQKPKFEIGQKVFYTACTTYQFNWNSDDIYKSDSDKIQDDIVLYGTIRSIECSGIKDYNEYFKYGITVEEYPGLERNNDAVEYRERNEERWNLDVNEENIFSLDELEEANKKAKQNHTERIKAESKYKKECEARHTMDNASMIYDFLMREAKQFDIKYTEEQLNAIYKLMSSPRISFEGWDTTYDLKEGVTVNNDRLEENLLDTDKKYIKLLRKCLKVEGYN